MRKQVRAVAAAMAVMLAAVSTLSLTGCGYNTFQTTDEQTSIQTTPELINDPAAFQKFQQAQGELRVRRSPPTSLWVPVSSWLSSDWL